MSARPSRRAAVEGKGRWHLVYPKGRNPPGRRRAGGGPAGIRGGTWLQVARAVRRVDPDHPEERQDRPCVGVCGRLQSQPDQEQHILDGVAAALRVHGHLPRSRSGSLLQPGASQSPDQPSPNGAAGGTAAEARAQHVEAALTGGFRPPALLRVPGLHQSLIQHGLAYFAETGGVGAIDVVDVTLLLAKAHALVVDSLHDFVQALIDRKSTRLNSSHLGISYA